MKIIKKPSEVIEHLNSIIKITDANKDALGFNAVGVYEDCINKGRIWVAVDGQGNYLGHLMHGGKPPQELRIFQICVRKKYRGSGVASSLIKEITDYGEQLSCLNLRADVAEDLTDAIQFWQAQGFCSLAARKKKNSTGRKVLIFHKRLSTPSLLPNDPLPLSITSKFKSNDVDSYVIDLNIFLTLIKKQAEEKLIAEIMQASMAGEFSLFVTPEFQEELDRNKKGDNDPILILAENALPVLEKIDETELYKLQEEIRAVVFPNRSKTRKNALQDQSDIRHLAYCIQNSKSGFITEEKALLGARGKLQEKYGLTLYSPEDFKIEYFGNIDPSPVDVPLSSEEGAISITTFTNTNQIKTFFDRVKPALDDVSNVFMKSKTRGTRERKNVSLDGEVCAVYLAQTKGAKHDSLEAFFVSLKDALSNRVIVFEHMLECFMRLSQVTNASKLLLHIREEDFDFEKICMSRGFERSDSIYNGIISLVKISCPLLITKANWKDFRTTILEHTNIRLPLLIPKMRDNSTGASIIQASIASREYEIELSQLETFLSPSLIMLPKRSGVIVPINPTYASDLLARDQTLLPFELSEEALLRLEKVYYRKPSHKQILLVGTPIVFYESGTAGRGVIGCARITSVKVCSYDNALKIYRKYGVLDRQELIKQTDKNGNVQVITFDNFKEFTNPIPMKRIKELGGAAANLVSPEKLTYEQLFHIVHEGMKVPSKDVLISIQPNYLAKILNGKKTIELRKKPFPANGGVRIWIYSSSPTSAVEATAFVTTVDQGTPDEIWSKYEHKCGISRKDFDDYFSGSKVAYALHISRVQKLNRKIKLERLKQISDGFRPPQYYRYIDHGSDLFDK
ncbi:MAG: GNAT family N-acetyltransferase, partial [Rhizobiales bacterium]|nr:GNAT family N-acetyltransferase [Hyphomicrobiales bacterium]